jgi:hypothetical protein
MEIQNIALVFLLVNQQSHLVYNSLGLFGVTYVLRMLFFLRYRVPNIQIQSSYDIVIVIIIRH